MNRPSILGSFISASVFTILKFIIEAYTPLKNIIKRFIIGKNQYGHISDDKSYDL